MATRIRDMARLALAAVIFVLASCSGAAGRPQVVETAVLLETRPVGADPGQSGPGTSTPGGMMDLAVTVTPEQHQALVRECTEMSGHIKRLEYPSHLLGQNVPVLIYLPPCYSDERQYPSLYLLHGKPQDENHWLILGIAKAADEGIRSGAMADLIMIMPMLPEPLFTGTDGGAGSYEGEFLSALMPFIEARYRSSPLDGERALAGISRGGVWALEIAFSNPAIFQGVGALSPALNVNDARPEYDPIDLALNAEWLPERIFLASGDVDSAAGETLRLHQVLVERGVKHRYSTVPGGHEGATWEQLAGEMLAYLSNNW